MGKITREDVMAMDAKDPLAHFRERFILPDSTSYLDGNSLGALPRETVGQLTNVIEDQWGNDLIGSWNKHDWIGLSKRIGDKIAPLIGAGSDEVIVCDSTSINLYKLVKAAVATCPSRTTLLTETQGFPTNRYMLESSLGGSSQLSIKACSREEIASRIDGETALVVLSHVNYRSGHRYDMSGVTAAAHSKGALILWDLSHSAGAIRVDLAECGADLAVGCGYKYLNGGPGAPAYLFVKKGLQDRLVSPLPGWLGHARPFDFEQEYEPADGLERFLCGTPPILAMAALEVGVQQFAGVALDQLFAKAQELGNLYIALMQQQCARHGFTLASPREADSRGSHVSFAHENAYAICQALTARGTVGDFRAPDLLRLGFAPLYTQFLDVWNAVNDIAAVMETREWADERFAVRNRVT